MGNFSKEIRAYALRNAIEFGKADAGKVLPKLFQHGLDKKDIKTIMPEIQKIVKQVNSLKAGEREKEFEKLKDSVIEHEEKERELPELPESGKNMVFRLAPFPSGALHIGNAKTYLLNALYAEKYKARTLLVMDDTIGSKEKQIMPEAYELIEDAFKWLDMKHETPVIYKSDRLQIYYEHAEKLIEKGDAYVCSCNIETLRRNREEGRECKCRSLPKDEQIKRWKRMFYEKEGALVLRIKTSMTHPNPAFRDRVLFKISNRKHPRLADRHRVWPTLEMSWTVDDYLLGITHILRGNDLMIETEMEKYIWDIFGWRHPVTMHTGLVKVEGVEAKISKSKAQKEVKSGKFIGWDDPRTWSIQSLMRRGIKKEAIREFVKEIGLNKHDISIPIDSLYAINRKMIDATSNRFAFIEKPVELKIEKSPKVNEVEVPVHPDKKETRKIRIGKSIFIPKKDFDSLKGREIRLIHLYNIKLGKKAEFTSSANKDIPKLQWVSEGVKTRILMDDGKWTEGLADEGIKKLKEGEMIQFERFAFCRFDGINKGIYEFWFSHK
jgi:glutamyl-tRNA synthetase